MRLEETLALLRALPIFAGVGSEALRLIGFSATPRSYRAGDRLFRRGDPAEGAFLVTEGEVALDAADDGGPARHVFGPGVLLGQAALFARCERPVTAIARSPVSALLIPRELVYKVMDAHPESAAALRDALARQNGELVSSLARAAALLDSAG